VILADTSVWTDHLRTHNHALRRYLAQGQVVMHPFVAAELALGSLRQRSKTLALFDLLPQVRVAQLSEVRHLIESDRLYAQGLGLADAHLIASVLLTPGTLLWTRDKPLHKAAETLAIHLKIP
jgi:predicted nucleic acid-binding protein